MIKNLIAVLLTALLVGACGSYGVSYPKPTYRYEGVAGDAEFHFESDFGTDTQFMAKTLGATDQPQCMAGAKTIGYLQQPDSYFRKADDRGPWKISAPTDSPILIAGYWWTYGRTDITSLVGGGTQTSVVRGESCRAQVMLVTPRKDGKYLVRLTRHDGRACRMSITNLDGSPAAEASVATVCMTR